MSTKFGNISTMISSRPCPLDADFCRVPQSGIFKLNQQNQTTNNSMSVQAKTPMPLILVIIKYTTKKC